MAVPATKLRAARALMDGEGLKGIRPLDLLRAAEEIGTGLSETLAVLAALLGGGQGDGPAPEATREARDG